MFKKQVKEASEGLHAKDRISLRNEMTDFYRLKEALDKTTESYEVLQYLVVELEGDRRPSFVDRILGRYTKMLTKEIKQGAYSWANLKEK